MVSNLNSEYPVSLIIQSIYFHCVEGGSATALLLISTGAQFAMQLKLNRRDGLLSLSTCNEDTKRLNIIFWTIYSLEKPLAMRLGVTSVGDSFLLKRRD